MGFSEDVTRAQILAVTPTTAGGVIVGQAGELSASLLHAKNPLLPPYNAKGDYNPDTDTGTDDTAAIQSWLNALAPFEMGYLPPNRLFLITTPLTTGEYVHLEGGGKSGGLFFKLTDTTKHGLNIGGTNTGSATAILRNFAIFGRTTPGQAAVAANNLAFPDIDLWIDGGWRYCLYCVDPNAFGDTTLGGIETGRIRLVRRNSVPIAGYAYIPPPPYHGIYNTGYSNAVRYDVDFQILGGYGIYLNGNYGSANGATTIRGSLQGISQTDLLEAIKIVYGNAMTLESVYTEACGAAIPVVLQHVIQSEVKQILGAVRLTTCTGIVVGHPAGVVTVDSDCLNCVVEGGQSDNPPLLNSSPSTITRGYRIYNTGGGQWASIGASDTDAHNLLLNGDFSRFIGAAGTAQNIWNALNSEGAICNYIGTQCGAGLTDTTSTAQSNRCALLQVRTGFGNTYALQAFAAGALTGLLGQTIWVSFKAKPSGGTCYLQVCDSSTGVANQLALTSGIAVENGFSLFRFAFAITSAMVTNGADVRISFPPPAQTYVSELMCGIGTSAPPSFIAPLRSPLRPDIRLIGGVLEVDGTAAPASGGDPIAGQAWQVGDRIRNTAPAASGTMGWVCVTAGSPGTWKTFGAIGA